MNDQASIPAKKRPHVVIIGAGFAGLTAAQHLKHADVDLTVVDKKNHHTFQPLLYQVALAVLSPAEIASPIRSILRGQKNTEVILGDVVAIDVNEQKLRIAQSDKPIAYDYLIVAAGAGHAYFGHDEWAPIAPGLKTVEDALEIRRRVLLVFEDAERLAASTGERPSLNFVVVGAGPTGVELAGAISDIAYRYMARDFHNIDPKQAKVYLLEGGPRVLPAYDDDLSASAEKQLRELNVIVRTNTKVTGIEPGKVHIGDEVLPSSVTLWAAGVAASTLGKQLGAKTDRAGRAIVGGDLTIPDHPNVFVVGDLASYADENGKPVPGVAPAAMQMGRFAAEMIQADLARESRRTFHYLDKGSLATIGRNRAVGYALGVNLKGYIAWVAWLTIHIFFLIGFRNRFFVMLEWAWSYFAIHRSARLITDKD